MVTRTSSVTSLDANMTPRRRKTLCEISLEELAKRTQEVYQDFATTFLPLGKEIELCRDRWNLSLEWAPLDTPEHVWKVLDQNPLPTHKDLWKFLGGRQLFTDAKQALDEVDERYSALKEECRQLGITKQFSGLERLREKVQKAEIYEEPGKLRKFMKMRKELHRAQELLQKKKLLKDIPNFWSEMTETHLLAYAEAQFDTKKRPEELDLLAESLEQQIPRYEALCDVLGDLEKYQAALKKLAPEVDWSLVNVNEVQNYRAECIYISEQIRKQQLKAIQTRKPQTALPEEPSTECCLPQF